MTDYNESVANTADFINSIQSVVPTGPTVMLLQFNKASGVFVNAIGKINLDYLNHDHYIYVEAEIDPVTQRVIGNVNNFKIVDIATTATRVYERQVNNQCKEKIHKRFQPEVQLDILREVLKVLCENSGITHEAFDDMNDYIDTCKRANKILKNSYISNPDFEFVTIEQEQQEAEAKLDGGLHELIGPSNLAGIGPYTTGNVL